MKATSPTPLLLAAVTLAAGGHLAFAQMSPADPRTFAYQGALEVDGAPASGDYDLRFGLFTSATPDTSCLLDATPSCTLWSAQVDGVHVAAGKFTALLDGVPDSALARDRLWLAIAVREAGETTFVALAGTQEILPAPWAARAAAAKDYKVTGDLTVAGDVDTTGAVLADTLYADNAAAIGAPGGRHLDLATSSLQSRDGAAPATLSLNPSGGSVVLGNAASAVSTAGSLSAGSLSVNNETTLNGALTVNAPARFRCPTGWSRNGAWCIEDNLRGGGDWDDAVRACHTQGGAVCPIEAILTCDIVQNGTCAAATDDDVWLWTSSTYGNDASAFNQIQVYNGEGNDADNEVDLTAATATTITSEPISYFCCRAAGGLD